MFATARVAAGVLFFDEGDRLLMVVPSYKDYLDIPGGYVEPGESPLAAARREVGEELGIAPPIGRLLAVDWAPGGDRDGDTDTGDKLIFLYDGGVLAEPDRAAIQVDGNEIVAYELHTLADLPRLTIPAFVRRITAAA